MAQKNWVITWFLRAVPVCKCSITDKHYTCRHQCSCTRALAHTFTSFNPTTLEYEYTFPDTRFMSESEFEWSFDKAYTREYPERSYLRAVNLERIQNPHLPDIHPFVNDVAFEVESFIRADEQNDCSQLELSTFQHQVDCKCGKTKFNASTMYITQAEPDDESRNYYVAGTYNKKLDIDFFDWFIPEKFNDIPKEPKWNMGLPYIMQI